MNVASYAGVAPYPMRTRATGRIKTTWWHECSSLCTAGVAPYPIRTRATGRIKTTWLHERLFSGKRVDSKKYPN